MRVTVEITIYKDGQVLRVERFQNNMIVEFGPEQVIVDYGARQQLLGYKFEWKTREISR